MELMINKRIASILSSVFMAAACWNTLDSKALAGNFLATCRNVRYSVSGTEEFVLYATCRRRNGSWVRSHINLDRYISNRNGYLSSSGAKFSYTCRNIALYSDGTLEAKCKTYNGDWRSTALNINRRISNIDGTLRVD